MKVQATAQFLDLRANKRRKKGEVFVVSKERYAEICEKLPGYLKPVK